MSLNVIERLHRRCVSENPVPSRAIVDPNTMLEKISEWVEEDVAEGIVYALLEYYRSNCVKVTGFRASFVDSLVNNECFWPVVEWREGDDVEVIALFYVDVDTVPETCGWLMHRGEGITDGKVDGRRWRSTSTSWRVSEMSHLKSTFQGALHLLCILEWPVFDMLVLYCHYTPPDHSLETYCPRYVSLKWHRITRYAKHLYLLINGTEDLGASFDEATLELEKMSLRRGTCSCTRNPSYGLAFRDREGVQFWMSCYPRSLYPWSVNSRI